MKHIEKCTKASSQNGFFTPLPYLADGVLSYALVSVCLSVHPISPSLYIWHTSNHHCIITIPGLVPHTIIFALRPLTLAWWPLPLLCLLPQNCQKETSHQCQNGTFASFCQYLRWVRRAVTLVDHWPTFQGYIGHRGLGLCLLVQYCLNKTSHQCQNGTFCEF